MRVIAVLKMQPLGQRRSEGYLAAVFAHGTTQDTEWIVAFASCYVIPTLDADHREVNVASCHRMTPRFLCKRANGCLERSARRG
jgi:hypothetical protein